MGWIWLDAAEIDDSLNAAFALVFTALDEGLAGDFHRSTMSAAQRYGIGHAPPQGTLFVP